MPSRTLRDGSDGVQQLLRFCCDHLREQANMGCERAVVAFQRIKDGFAGLNAGVGKSKVKVHAVDMHAQTEKHNGENAKGRGNPE